ncbi:MAG: hypothetical protein M1302_00655 [Candidatus Thermoplasmatota archaeon]|nr:hypothetical protein [Candidatus Thermoplasmatota archaeon]
MTLKVLMVIIVLSILLPILVIIPDVSSGSSIQSPVSSPGYYNFTAMQSGQYPSNTSWVSFNNTPLNSYSHMAAGKAAPVSGFDVNTSAPLSSPEYFYVNLNGTANESLKITYSWSDAENLLTTIDNLIVMQGDHDIIHYFFGPGEKNDASNQYVYGKTIQKLGQDPAMDAFQTVELSWNSLYPGKIFFSAESGYNSTGNFPLVVSVNSTLQPGNFSLLVGGSNCSITMDELYVAGHDEGFSPLQSRNYSYELQQSGNVTSSMGNASEPVLDPELNDVLFVAISSNISISYWNYANQTAGIITQVQSLWEGKSVSEVSGNMEYIAYGNSTEVDMIAVNLANLSVSCTLAHGHFPYFTGIFFLSGRFVMVSRFSLVAINFTSGSSTSYNISLGSSSSVVAVNQSQGSITGTDLNLSTGETSYFTLNETLKMTEVHGQAFHGNIEDTGAIWETQGIYGVLVNATTDGDYSFWVESGNYSRMLMINGSLDTWSGSGGAALHMASGQAEFLVHDSVILSNIFVRNITGVYLDANASAGAVAAGNNLYIFYSTSEPLSPDGIAVRLDPVGIITHNSTVGYSVESNLTYSLNVTLDGTGLPASNGNIAINASLFPTGTYRLTATASNIAGYSSSVYEDVSIDSQRPVISVNPGNRTYISQSQGFAVNITGTVGNGTTSVQWNGGTFTSSSLSFGLFVSSNPGKLVLWVNFTDSFGIVHSRWFNYTTITGISGGTSIGITNGTFYSRNNITVHWGGVGNASHYDLYVRGAHGNNSYQLDRNWTTLNLTNGNYVLSLNVTLLDGETVLLGSRNFWIETFRPMLSVNTSGSRFLSFYGDSSNDTLTIKATSNVTSQISASIIYGGTVLQKWGVDGKNWSTILDRGSDLFHQNGTYHMDIQATGQSGLISYRNLSWSVNNTIPAVPFFQDPLIYTNSTVLHFMNADSARVSITANISSGKSWVIYSAHDGNITLPYGNSTYNVTFYARNIWNNSANDTIRVMSYDQPPAISVSVANLNLSGTNITTLAFSVTDAVPAYVEAKMGNSTVLYSGEADHGNLTMHFHADGNYSVFLTVTDLCGNINRTEITGINVTYYPQITGIGIAYSIISGFAEFHPVVHGTDLQNLRYSWTVSGHPYGGSSVNIFLLPGYHTVKLDVQFNGHGNSTTTTVFTLGFIPELLAVIVPVSLVAYRQIAYVADEDAAAELILGMRNGSIRDIMRKGRATRIRKKTMESVLRRMVDSGKILILADPDGQKYAMDPLTARRRN